MKISLYRLCRSLQAHQRAFLAQMKISRCVTLFDITYKNSFLSKETEKNIKDKIGKIRKNTNEELDFYKELQRQFISNKPLEIDLLRLSFIIDAQKKLIDELITLLNTSDLTTGYKRKMLKCIRAGLIEDLNPQANESKSATHKRRA